MDYSEIDLSETDVVREVLAERGLDAEQVLTGLMLTLAEDYMLHAADGGPMEQSGLQMLCRTLEKHRQRTEQIQQRLTERSVGGARLDIPDWAQQRVMTRKQPVQEALYEVATRCLAIAQRDDQARPPMRIAG